MGKSKRAFRSLGGSLEVVVSDCDRNGYSTLPDYTETQVLAKTKIILKSDITETLGHTRSWWPSYDRIPAVQTVENAQVAPFRKDYELGKVIVGSATIPHSR